jgi:hypothetical protein
MQADTGIEPAAHSAGQRFQIDLESGARHQALHVPANRRPIAPTQRCVHVRYRPAVFTASQIPHQAGYLGRFFHIDAFVPLFLQVVEIQLASLRRSQTTQYSGADRVLIGEGAQLLLDLFSMLELQEEPPFGNLKYSHRIPPPYRPTGNCRPPALA